MEIKKRKLLTVILTWNDFENTSKCLECCKKIKQDDITFLLVDNNSTDGSLEHLIKKFELEEIKNTNSQKQLPKISIYKK